MSFLFVFLLTKLLDFFSPPFNCLEFISLLSSDDDDDEITYLTMR